MNRQQDIETRATIDAQCDEFETLWRSGDRREIRDLIERVPAHAQQELFRELLALELELRARDGKSPDKDHYHEQYANYASVVESVFSEFDTWAAETSALSPQDLIDHTNAETLPSQHPEKIGRYRVERELGKGGMGTVLLARDTVLDRQIALKLPHLDPRTQREAVQRFYREARVMATVHHPALCPIYDVGEHENHPYLAMAFIDGQTLADRMSSDEPLTHGQSVKLVHTLALAIHEAHVAGVVHRDLKPGNVMIDLKNQPWITDFGLAIYDDTDDSSVTTSGTAVGSPAYMAPEQVQAEVEKVGPHTDVYALGVILYELLCDRRPFEGRGLSVLSKITSGTAPKKPSQFVEIAPHLEAVCLKALAFAPDQRYATAAEFARALSEHCDRRAEPKQNLAASSKRTFLWAGFFLMSAVVGVLAVMMLPKGPRGASAYPSPRSPAQSPSPKPPQPTGQNFCLEFDGVSSYVHVPGLTRNEGEPATLECWLSPRPHDHSVAIMLWGGKTRLQLGSDRNVLWFLEENTSVASPEKNPSFDSSAWIHVAIVVDETETRLYVQGTIRYREPRDLSKRYHDGETTPDFWIGAHSYEGNVLFHSECGIDELRVSSVARYSSDFEPSRRFKSDEDTIALYHFDEGEGQRINDASGNAFHGKIHVATWLKRED